MKKMLSKLRRTPKRGAQQQPSAQSLRITNETVAEHRERILAGGRKFKYPHQYPKHRIVLITAGLVAFLVVALLGVCTWQLYGVQNTGKFFYRVTQVVPVPVAEVDGRHVRYSDYLVELRSTLHYLSVKEAVNFSSDDGKRQLDYQKRLALNKAIESAYIQKIAAEKNIAVTDKEVDDFVNQEISNNRLGVTKDVYSQVIKDYYDWSFDDYKASLKKQLMRRKVISAIDVEGRKQIDSIAATIAQGGDFAAIAKQYSEDMQTKQNGGDIGGFVPKNSDDPNGLAKAAATLQTGQVSSVIQGVDGFYMVKSLEAKGSDIRFAKIYVAYKTFDKQLQALKKDKKIKEFITVPETISSNKRS